PSCVNNVCEWNSLDCSSGDPNETNLCDPKVGCEHFPNMACPDYLNVTDVKTGSTITFDDITGAQIALAPTESTNVCSSVPDVPTGIMVTSCGNSVNACDELQNTSSAAVTATDVSGNQFPIQPGGNAVICNSVPLVP